MPKLLECIRFYSFLSFIEIIFIVIFRHKPTFVMNRKEALRFKYSKLNNSLQKFLDRCIVEEGDPEDENYKVNRCKFGLSLYRGLWWSINMKFFLEVNFKIITIVLYLMLQMKQIQKSFYQHDFCHWFIFNSLNLGFIRPSVHSRNAGRKTQREEC